MRDRPQVLPSLQAIWDGFWDLDSCRGVAGGGMGPAVLRSIPWDRREEWLDRRGYTGQRRAFADGLLRLLDGLYLQDQYERLQNGGAGHDDGEDGVVD